jgi:hypothetical protein
MKTAMKTDRSPISQDSREKQMMLPACKAKSACPSRVLWVLAASLLVFFIIAGASGASPGTNRKGFATPEAAVQAFAAAMRSKDTQELLSIFGSAEKELFSSGDRVSDQQQQDKFIQAYDLKNSIVPEGPRMVLIVGEKDWPFPIPLVKQGEKWFFDTAAGKEEILDRRIGQNELSTVQTLLAVVDAQREYAMIDRDNNGLREYAQTFGSDPGKKNGLFWENRAGEALSPLGELAADAWAEGYSRKGSKQGPIPYHGYYFRMLKRQGAHARGGAFDYFVKGHMIGGFGVVAYPAVYGSSGVMTFIVNHEGVVYEKDLGKKSAQTAKEIKSFDPDPTWRKTE